MTNDNNETKRCPYCGEEIKAAAIKCKHCGEYLEYEEAKNDKKQGSNIFKKVGIGCLSVIAFFMILGFIASFDENENTTSTSLEEKSYETAEEGISGNATFLGFGMCNNGKVGDILARKYAEAIINSRPEHANVLSLYTLKTTYPNLKFTLSNPRKYDNVYYNGEGRQECTCDVEFNNIDPNIAVRWSWDSDYKLQYKDAICSIGYKVEEMDGKYRVTLNSLANDHISCQSIAGFE